MAKLFNQYDRITKRFLDNVNVELNKLSKLAAEEGAKASRNKIREEQRIDTGKMIRSTAGVTWEARGTHRFKIRSRAINIRNDYNYSFAQNYGTSRGIVGIFFIEEGRDFIEQVVLTDNNIYNAIRKAWIAA